MILCIDILMKIYPISLMICIYSYAAATIFLPSRVKIRINVNMETVLLLRNLTALIKKNRWRCVDFYWDCRIRFFFDMFERCFLLLRYILKSRLTITGFRDFDAFLRIGPFCICDGGDQLAPVHIRPLNHLYESERSKVRDEKEGNEEKCRDSARTGGRTRVNRNLQHPRKSGVIYPPAPLPSLLTPTLLRTPYYPELRLIDTRLPAVIYISRVI